MQQQEAQKEINILDLNIALFKKKLIKSIQCQLQYNIFVIINQNMEQKSKQVQGEKKIEKYIFSLDKKLGEGSYSIVYQGRTISNNDPVAVKVIDKKIFINSYNIRNLYNQIEIMKKMDHKNIVKLLDVYQTSNNMYIVTELCEDGDLSTLLKTQKKLSEKQALQYLKDILSGFQYLLKKEIIHRDLKPANILIKNGICKIADFGFAKNLEEGSNTILQSIVGTPLYMSPQILARTNYTNRSDLWSIGLIYYQLLHGHTPWPSKTEIQLILNMTKKPISFDATISEDSRNFIKGCLKLNEQERLTWQQAFKSKLLAEVASQKAKKIIDKEEDKQNKNTINLKDTNSNHNRSISSKIRRRNTSQHNIKKYFGHNTTNIIANHNNISNNTYHTNNNSKQNLKVPTEGTTTVLQRKQKAPYALKFQERKKSSSTISLKLKLK